MVNTFTISSFLFSIMLSIVYFSKERSRNVETKLYNYLVRINLLMGLVATVSYFLIMYIPSSIVTVIFNKLLLLLYISWMAIFTLYLFKISEKFRSRKKKQKRVLYLLADICYTVLAILILVLPIQFHNADNKIYSYGLSPSILYVATFICFLVWTYSILVNYKNFNSKKYIPLYIMEVIAIIVVIIQRNYPEALLITWMFSYVTFIMYFTIENPDTKLMSKLEQAKSTAEKANRAKTDFLSSMSHEIRTPLNAIVGFSDCVLEESTLEDAYSDAKDIKLASENLLEIVNGILDISKIEADKMDMVETNYILLDVLKNTAKLVKPRIGDKPIDFVLKFEDDLPYMLYGDCGKLRQIITNILTNAVKYTEEGSIVFSVGCVNHEETTDLVISVEDTGRGIKPEQINKLFDKFERLDEDKNTTLEGTGLGLAITKKFVEMLGGKIVVQSKYGEGSKFTVYLRQKILILNKPENIEENVVKHIDILKQVDLTNAHILVVDDNKINIKVALKLLSNLGIQAESCESGAECIEILKNKKYDLILLDDMMPRMSGVETLKIIKSQNDFNTPIVALTANAIAGMKEKYLNDGFDDYLAKPIEKDELYRILVTYIKEISDSDILKSKKILIVDDNKINIKIASKFLQDYNFIIDSCSSGTECLNKTKIEHYDLIFMDYMMPGMDGIETLKHLKESSNFSTPIICLTADAVAGSREKFLDAGFNEYLAKPIDRKILDEYIKKFLK